MALRLGGPKSLDGLEGRDGGLLQGLREQQKETWVR